MDFQSKKEGDITIVALGGRLDAVTAPEFEKEIRARIDEDDGRFVLDLEQLDYISSAGLRALLVVAKLLEAKAGQICLSGVAGNVKSVFEMSRFNIIFKMEDSVAAAVEALGDRP